MKYDPKTKYGSFINYLKQNEEKRRLMILTFSLAAIFCAAAIPSWFALAPWVIPGVALYGSWMNYNGKTT